MKILHLSHFAIDDVSEHSGTPYHIYKALCSAHSDVVTVEIRAPKFLRWLQVPRYFYDRIRGYSYDGRLDVHRYRHLVQAMNLQIESTGKDCDVIFGPAVLGCPLPEIRTDKPVVVYADSTFANLLEYPCYSNFSNYLFNLTDDRQRRLLDRCAMTIFSSEWAASSAVEKYHADPRKIKVIPYGANLSEEPDSAEVSSAIERRSKEICHLIFLSMAWERKGGDTIVSLVHKIREFGVDARLSVVGTSPPKSALGQSWLCYEGCLSKYSQEDRQKLAGLFRRSHFSLLAPIADCTPIVIAEASAFGVPTVSVDVGGVCSMITDGVNGYVLPRQDFVDRTAELIARRFGDPVGYRQLAASSRRHFQTRLNWTAFVNEAISTMRQLC